MALCPHTWQVGAAGEDGGPWGWEPGRWYREVAARTPGEHLQPPWDLGAGSWDRGQRDPELRSASQSILRQLA